MARGLRVVVVVAGLALGVAGAGCSKAPPGAAPRDGAAGGAAAGASAGAGGSGGAAAGAGGAGQGGGGGGGGAMGGAAGLPAGADAGMDVAADGRDGAAPEAGGAGGQGGGGGQGGAAGRGGAPPVPLTWGAGADFPYRVGSYDEPLRPQFHFTAPMGWINDANGMWYEGGLYHLSYQASPFSLASEWGKFWGHAISPDLVHWTHVPIMLHPGMNVPGPAWSGSTVQDVDNTSGLRTGSAPLLVTLYTDTDRGTSIAYSNDRGLTWKAYANNPVAIGGPNEQTRDPHVFWHEPTRRWVCALFEDGTTFYTSANLRDWKKTGHVAFGFECPDIYELSIDGDRDGDAEKHKWVLQDASGSYLLGGFDGETFTPDSPTPLKMNASSDFYAGQTFYRRTFPDERVVQIAWIRGGAATAPWNQALTFPAEVRLRTFPEGVRVARRPIAELAALRGTARHLGATVVAAQVNALPGFSGRAFDLEVTIDRAKTTATSLTFGVGAASFVYDVAKGTIFGATVSPLAGHVTVRILRDWGQYEVYVNDGEVSFTKDFAFAPGDTGSRSRRRAGSWRSPRPTCTRWRAPGPAPRRTRAPSSTTRRPRPPTPATGRRRARTATSAAPAASAATPAATSRRPSWARASTGTACRTPTSASPASASTGPYAAPTSTPTARPGRTRGSSPPRAWRPAATRSASRSRARRRPRPRARRSCTTTSSPTPTGEPRLRASRSRAAAGT